MKTGKCIYCGQQNMVDIPDTATEQDCDIKATEQCKCEQAKKAKELKKIKLKSEANIEEYFTKDFPEMAEILKAAVGPIAQRKIEKITIDTGWGIQGKISITSKGKIKVEKVETKKLAVES